MTSLREHSAVTISQEKDQTCQNNRPVITFAQLEVEFRRRGVELGFEISAPKALPPELCFDDLYLEQKSMLMKRHDELRLQQFEPLLRLKQSTLQELTTRWQAARSRADQLREREVSENSAGYLIRAGYVMLTALVWILKLMLEQLMPSTSDGSAWQTALQKWMEENLLKPCSHVSLGAIILIAVILEVLPRLWTSLRSQSTYTVILRIGRWQGAVSILLLGSGIGYKIGESKAILEFLSPLLLGAGFALAAASLMLVLFSSGEFAFGKSLPPAATSETKRQSARGVSVIVPPALRRLRLIPKERLNKLLLFAATAGLLVLLVLMSAAFLDSRREIVLASLALYLALGLLCFAIGKTQEGVFRAELATKQETDAAAEELRSLREELKRKADEHAAAIKTLELEFRRLRIAFLDGFDYARRSLNTSHHPHAA